MNPEMLIERSRAVTDWNNDVHVSLLEILLPNFISYSARVGRFPGTSSYSNVISKFLGTFFYSFPLSPSFGLEVKAKGDRRI